MEKRSLIFFAASLAAFFFINTWLFPQKAPSTSNETQQTEEVVKAAPPLDRSKEKFYVLENEFQQVVVSNWGGAIAEINLPFSKNTNIQPIHLDQQIATDSPENSHFPNFPAFKAKSDGTRIKVDPKDGGYTPLLRRTLFGNPGENTQSFEMSPRNYALYLHENEGDTPLYYDVTQLTPESIEMVARTADRVITKSFHLPKGPDAAPYAIEMGVSVNGEKPANLWVTSGVLEAELVSGQYSPSLQYLDQSHTKAKVESLKLPKSDKLFQFLQPRWVSHSNGFFGTILNVQGQNTSGIKTDIIDAEDLPSRLSLVNSTDYPAYEMLLPYTPSAKTTKFLLYAGPYNKNLLAKVDTAYSETEGYKNLEFTKAAAVSGWFSSILSPFSKVLLWMMKGFYAMTHSWGFAIILLTIALRFLLFPLNSWSLRSSAKMQKLNPKIKALQEKYKNDPKTMNQELAMLYRNEGLNPLSAFVPILIQLPVLFAMFSLLRTTFELRGMAFIPGWINDLAAPDVLFSWGTHIPFIGSSFHLLPIILAGASYLQHVVSQKLNPPDKSKGKAADNPMQMAHMGIIKTVLMLVLFYNMASGLNIYWITSTLFDIVQQWYISRSKKKGKGPAKLRRAKSIKIS